MEMLNMLARALIVFMNLDFNHWLFHFVKVRSRYLANVANLIAPAVLSQKSLSNMASMASKLSSMATCQRGTFTRTSSFCFNRKNKINLGRFSTVICLNNTFSPDDRNNRL